MSIIRTTRRITQGEPQTATTHAIVIARRTFARIAGATGLACAMGVTLPFVNAHAADAQWPNRPVRIVVPFSAGGTTDLSARIIAEALQAKLGQSFIVENLPGAGGNIGAANVAHAKPDGYTLLMGTPGTQAINKFLFRKMQYDPEKDFEPVSYVVRVPNVLVVPNSDAVPQKTAKELIDFLKANPGRYTYGSSGNGTTIHLAMEMLKAQAGIRELPHVPYKGSGQMLPDLISGQVQLATDNLPASMNFIKAGKLRALAVTSGDEAPGLPGVPPLNTVIPGFEAVSWFVLMAPKGTPKSIIDRLSRVSDEFLKTPEAKQKLNDLGAVPVGGTPEDLGKFIASEIPKWKKAVEDSGAKVD